MLTQQKLILSLTLVLLTASAQAAPLVYVVTDSQQFGTVDLGTGAFHQIGPNTPEGQASLVPGPNGSLFSLTFSGNLESINTANGVTSVIGATGLGGSAIDLAQVGGTLYATDFSNNLYTVNSATGATHLIGPTGIPGVPSDPGDQFEESLYGVGGKLYATFEATTPFPALTPVIGPSLYQINPSTGIATLLAPTSLHLLSSVNVNATFYAFKGLPDSPFSYSTSQVVTLNLANGNTSFVTNIDRAATGILGAAPAVPEPASAPLAAIGIAAIVVLGRRRRAPRASRERSPF